MTTAPFQTHTVENQACELVDFNRYATDDALRDAVRHNGAAWDEPDLLRIGQMTGSADFIELGELANRHPPQLHAFNRFGHRINEVRYHEAYHALMRFSVEEGLASMPWTDDRAGSWVARLARCYLVTQVEQGHGCPITMTFASVPAIRWQPQLAAQWLDGITSRHYDSRNVPATDKRGLTVGMAMTEKQGGSDVRANTTRATPDGDGWRLVGHKWFCSAPMSDLFLTLAQTQTGLTCFVVPRWTPGGQRNAMHIQRLKDKVGNKSNASSEIEYAGAWAAQVGEEGRGVRTIIDMVAHTRLDCVMGSASVMRAALAQATWHARHRRTFGKRLIDHPLMKNVLADLALEAEAAIAISLRLGRAYEQGRDDPQSAALARIATAASKYYVCKRAPAMVYEALECLGGNGYVEEAPLARLYREAPLNSVWEGSGNVMCLDVLRAMVREPSTLEALQQELGSAVGADRHYDSYVRNLAAAMRDAADIQLRARHVVEQIALALQACALLKQGHSAVSDAFIESRLGGGRTTNYGTLSPSINIDHLVSRAVPA